MSKVVSVLAVFVVLGWAGLVRAAADDGGEGVLEKLYKPHPRLFVRADQVDALREAVKTDPMLREWHRQVKTRGERMLSEKPAVHELIGPRLLGQSRAALGRISTLAGLYLIDRDERYARRAREEMFTVIAFPDWNPSHFLDVAEMSNAVGIGYDWLYDFLSPEDRKAIRAGLIKLGLQPGLDGFEKGAWWTKATHNWSQVCNGGLTVGALAIADEEPAIAGKLIPLCRKAIQPSMKAFAPDGGFAEGPGYWSYATIYNCYYLGAIESALRTDFGLKSMSGFDRTGFYRMDSIGPLGKTFNYADAGEGAGRAPQMFYLSHLFNQPAFATYEAKSIGNGANIFHLIWHTPIQDKLEIPLDAAFRGVNVAYFRSAWDDPKALYVGIKGGDNRTNHSHLDLGSFVIDALGRRWAVDLGGDDYNLPGYFGRQRWTYYRLRTESHNTITLDGENQQPDGKAPIVAYMSGAARSHVVIDLTNGYRKQATKVQRGLAMLKRSAVLVQDEIEAEKPADVVWNLLTPSKIEISGRTATLTQGAETLTATILSPADASFAVVSANPPKPQKQ